MKTKRVHLDATKPDRIRTALCGWTANIETATDVSRVTCQSCLHKFRGTTAASERKALAAVELGRQMAAAFAATLTPCAGAPPRMTPPLWATVCRSTERRCGACIQCEWEREAERWAFAAPWQRRHVIRRPEGAPAWPSLAAALVALAEWEVHDRHGPSAFGFMLDRCRRGDMGDGGASRPEDPLLRRAGDLARIRQALDDAYPEGGHEALSPAICKGLLLARTPGVLVAVPSYEEFAERLAVAVGVIRALVRSGRTSITVELAARGLIPPPKPSRGLFERIAKRRERIALR